MRAYRRRKRVARGFDPEVHRYLAIFPEPEARGLDDEELKRRAIQRVSDLGAVPTRVTAIADHELWDGSVVTIVHVRYEFPLPDELPVSLLGPSYGRKKQAWRGAE